MVLQLGHARLSLDYDSGIAGELELEGDSRRRDTLSRHDANDPVDVTFDGELILISG